MKFPIEWGERKSNWHHFNSFKAFFSSQKWKLPPHLLFAAGWFTIGIKANGIAGAWETMEQIVIFYYLNGSINQSIKCRNRIKRGKTIRPTDAESSDSSGGQKCHQKISWSCRNSQIYGISLKSFCYLINIREDFKIFRRNAKGFQQMLSTKRKCHRSCSSRKVKVRLDENFEWLS